MWLLMIVFFYLDGQDMTLRQPYATRSACMQERNRIGDEMAKSYPGDDSFAIRCVYSRPAAPKLRIGGAS